MHWRSELVKALWTLMQAIRKQKAFHVVNPRSLSRACNPLAKQQYAVCMRSPEAKEVVGC